MGWGWGDGNSTGRNTTTGVAGRQAERQAAPLSSLPFGWGRSWRPGLSFFFSFLCEQGLPGIHPGGLSQLTTMSLLKHSAVMESLSLMGPQRMDGKGGGGGGDLRGEDTTS